MNFEFSDIGQHISSGSGIEQLMDDLGHALASGGSNMRMLGGGNPSAIPEITAVWRDEMQRLLTQQPDRFDRMLVNYDPCRGNPEFIDALVAFFNRQYGWELTHENVVVTNGGQTAFFYLINLFAGRQGKRNRKILLPLVPEYIGYANQGFGADTFRAVKPTIEYEDDQTFKYRVDFDAMQLDNDVAAICVSRPTNPTGNVLTDDEIERLRLMAADRDIPLIIDNAYGAPFPNIIFGDVTPPWGENIILTYSLSKLGLPGTRTGIVIGPPQVTQAISSINAIAGLANGNIGQVLVTELLQSGRVAELSKNVIRPYYEQKSLEALQLLEQAMPAGSYAVHASEGALFLWLRLQMSITSLELYERLKRRGVLVVPGEYFFFGLREPWAHEHECIRMTFSMQSDVVRAGIQILADEIMSLQA